MFTEFHVPLKKKIVLAQQLKLASMKCLEADYAKYLTFRNTFSQGRRAIRNSTASTLEGNATLMLEIQALVESTAVYYGTPQRSTTGYNAADKW
jgi:predicted ATP-dependent serine protease